MTVAKTHSRKDYVGNGSNLIFAFDFKIYDEIDLLVYVAGIPKILDTDYTVSGGPTWTESGGNVTFVVAPPTGAAVLIYRELTVVQGTHWPEGDPFPCASHENAADRLVMLAQQFKEAIGRVFKVVVTSLLSDIEVPEGAGKLWGWNAAGDGAAVYNQIIDTGVITTKGDLVIGGATGIAERKAIGTAGQIATVASGTVTWADRTLVKLDDAEVPDDNTDLNASTSKHGLCPKFDNDVTHFLSGKGTQIAPPRDPLPGEVVQVVHVQTGESAVGTTAIPYDDSIPQITEGNEYMTLAIIPKSATNKLKIDVVFNFTHTIATAAVAAALFQDATAPALAMAGQNCETAGAARQIVFTHYMDAGTVISTTFRVRAGGSTGITTVFNGQVSGARIYGGVMASSITITEIQV